MAWSRGKKRPLSHTVEDAGDEFMTDNLEDIIRDVGVDAFKEANMVDTLRRDVEDSLYSGCKIFTRLSALLRLLNLKEIGGWTDKSFTELLELLKEILPEGNTFPNRTYEAKKILCPMGLDYVRIHVFPNDCILYRKEFENLKECPRCGASHYKQKDNGVDDDDSTTSKPVSAKVMWYQPIVPKFKRLFANFSDAKNIRWHADERVFDGKFFHIADSLQWKKLVPCFQIFPLS